MNIKLSDHIINLCKTYGVEIEVCDKDQFRTIHLEKILDCRIGYERTTYAFNIDGTYKIYVCDNFNTAVLNLDDSIRKIISELIQDGKVKCLENKFISQTVIDYIQKWNVRLILLEDNIFSQCRYKFTNKSNPFSHACYVDWVNKVIYANISQFNGSNDKLLLHELTHIMMRVKPEYVSEFTSPFMSAWLLNLQACNISLSDEKRKTIMDLWGKHGYNTNSFDEFKNYKLPQLIETGIFNSDGSPTFDLVNIKPKLEWVNIDSLI